MTNGDTIALVNTRCRILELAPELLINVLSCLRPYDLISFGRTSKPAYDFISPSNQPLWRSTFLHVFDDPRDVWAALLPTPREAGAVRESEWNWYDELRRRMDALRLVTHKFGIQRHKFSREEYSSTVDVLLDIYDTAVANIQRVPTIEKKCSVPDHTSLNMLNLTSALRMSSHTEKFIHDFHPDIESPFYMPELQSTWPGRPMTRSIAQVQNLYEPASRLHVYYGLTQRERQSRQSIGAARALVYDWFLTGADTDYGPYKRDDPGAINWHVLEGVCTVIRLNFELVADGRVHYPDGLFRFSPSSVEIPPSYPQDWARATGQWLGTYSFLDYSDLFHFNVGFRPGPRPTLDGHVEACGDLMRLQLELDDEIKDDARLRTKLPVCHDLPVLYFSGISRGHGSHRAVISVRGTASLIPGGKQVRWRFIIR